MVKIFCAQTFLSKAYPAYTSSKALQVYWNSLVQRLYAMFKGPGWVPKTQSPLLRSCGLEGFLNYMKLVAKHVHCAYWGGGRSSQAGLRARHECVTVHSDWSYPGLGLAFSISLGKSAIQCSEHSILNSMQCSFHCIMHSMFGILCFVLCILAYLDKVWYWVSSELQIWPSNSSNRTWTCQLEKIWWLSAKFCY